MTIALIGCGKMGSALLRGWLDRGVPGPFAVLEPGDLPPALRACADAGKVSHLREAAALGKGPPPEVMVLAVKPQIMDAVCETLRPALGPGTLILSIAAGRTLASFHRLFGADRPVVRAMPNTPAAIGKGVTVAVASEGVPADRRAAATRLLEVTGPLEWVEDEGLMDAVTAVSGSGPAYVFALIEVLAAAGARAGLPTDLAMRLARQTVIGAAALAEADSATPAADLRRAVTSPGGTTAAALEVLLAADGGLQPLFDRAINAAVARSRTLGAAGS